MFLYGRHENGTEIEPEELRLLRLVGEAAAIAYETVEASAMREHIKVLQAELRKFKTDAAFAQNAPPPPASRAERSG